MNVTMKVKDENKHKIQFYVDRTVDILVFRSAAVNKINLNIASHHLSTPNNVTSLARGSIPSYTVPSSRFIASLGSDALLKVWCPARGSGLARALLPSSSFGA